MFHFTCMKDADNRSVCKGCTSCRTISSSSNSPVSVAGYGTDDQVMLQGRACSSSSNLIHSTTSSLSNGCKSSDDGRKKKKARTTFSGRQIFELEKQFEEKKYLSSSERSEMAALLSVTDTQVLYCIYPFL